MKTHFLIKNYFKTSRKKNENTHVIKKLNNKEKKIVMYENHAKRTEKSSNKNKNLANYNYDVNKKGQLVEEMSSHSEEKKIDRLISKDTCHDNVGNDHGLTDLNPLTCHLYATKTNEEIRWCGKKRTNRGTIKVPMCLNTSFRIFDYLIYSFINFTFLKLLLVNNKNCDKVTNHDRLILKLNNIIFTFLTFICLISLTAANEFDKTELFRGNKISEQSIAAVFNKVAYGSTTKRSIPDNAYLYTTLATPLLTTYRYSDGNQQWYRVDVEEPTDVKQEREEDLDNPTEPRRNYDDDYKRKEDDYDLPRRTEDRDYETRYGSELEKDHALPTSAPAADILKNNNNNNYKNPNRYNNDRLRPDLLDRRPDFIGDRNAMRTSTTMSILKNVPRPTKSMFGKEVPSYVPPSRSFFTPPLPPEYLNPFADKPTLRGTNSESYHNRRPIPPPSLMPKKDRIPFRPDLPGREGPMEDVIIKNERPDLKPSLDNKNSEQQRPSKKTLNTPSQNINVDRLGEFFGLNRLHNESNFEFEPMAYIPSISRILSGSNGRKEDIPDILLRTVTATPNIQRNTNTENKNYRENFPTENRSEKPKEAEIPVRKSIPEITQTQGENLPDNRRTVQNNKPAPFPEVKVPDPEKEPMVRHDTTTIASELLNLPNVKEKSNRVEVSNASKSNADEIWHICWNVHVYLVVFLYILLAIFSIVKLIRFEKETHMFSKSYFLSIHLLLTTICVLRIFYLVYDPYNTKNSFTNFMYDFLHNFPLSLLATTFAILIVFLLKRTLNHLKVKTRPIFLVVFGLGHIFLCFCLNLSESLELFGKNTFLSLVCKFVFILLCWSLGLSYVYLYKIIKNVLAKKSQNLSEICTQNISYASHITIAVALLFTLLGCVELYGLFFIKIDRFTAQNPYHWILWGFELSIRFLEISIITLLAIVVSLRMSQREKQNVGFPLFPCTTSDSSTDNIYPNNCSTNLNALNYSLRSQNQYRQDLALDNLPTDIVERPNLLKNSFQNDSFEKKNTLDRFQSGRNSANCLESDRSNKYDRSSLEAERSDHASSDYEKGDFDRSANNFERFERPNWGSQRFDNVERFERDNFPIRNFERAGLSDTEGQPSSGHFERNSGRRTFDRASPADFPKPHYDHGSGRSKTYEKSKYYMKPKFDNTDLYNNDEYQRDFETRPKIKRPDLNLERDLEEEHNVYSEPLDVNHEYERTRHDFERSDFDRRSKSSWNNSGRRSLGRSGRKGNNRPNMGIQTLPNQDMSNSMLVDENGFVRFRHMGEHEKPVKKHKHSIPDNHYSDA